MSPSLLCQRGNDAFRNGKYGKAAWLYARALRKPAINEDDTLACLSNHAEVYLCQEKWELAEADARDVLQHDGNHVKSKFRLTKALSQVGQLSEARALVNALLSSSQ